MKLYLFAFSTLLVSFLTAQTEEDIAALQNQIDTNKSKIERLHSDVNKVVTENIYLKEVLDIQKPIKEVTDDNTNYKLVAVSGDKRKRNILVEVLLESLDVDKRFDMPTATMVDILGNNYKIDYYSISAPQATQYKNVPLNMTFEIKNVKGEPKFIKIFEIRSAIQPIGGSYRDKYNTVIQFRDLPVNWE